MPNQYALSSLSELMAPEIMKCKDSMIAELKELYLADPEKYKSNLRALEAYELNSEKIKKVNIKETFGFYKQLKDGT